MSHRQRCRKCGRETLFQKRGPNGLVCTECETEISMDMAEVFRTVLSAGRVDEWGSFSGGTSSPGVSSEPSSAVSSYDAGGGDGGGGGSSDSFGSSSTTDSSGD